MTDVATTSIVFDTRAPAFSPFFFDPLRQVVHISYFLAGGTFGREGSWVQVKILVDDKGTYSPNQLIWSLSAVKLECTIAKSQGLEESELIVREFRLLRVPIATTSRETEERVTAV